MGFQETVRDADPHHKVRQSLAFAILAPDHPGTISLGINPPPAEVSADPLGRNRRKPLSCKPSNLVQALPGIPLPLEPLHPLRLRFFGWNCHKCKKPTASISTGGGLIISDS